MYGFLTTGGSLSNTEETDVILRTTQLNSKIAIGNSNDTTGGLYIYGNNVGVQCVPSSNNALHVNGNATFFNNKTTFYASEHDHANVVQIMDNRISMMTSYCNVVNKETAFLDTSGIIKNNIIVTNSVHVPQVELFPVHIVGVARTTVYDVNDVPTPGFKVKIPSRFREDFPSLVKLIMINRCIYNLWRIRDAGEYIELDLTYHLKEQDKDVVNFNVGDDVNVQLLFDIRGNEENYAKLINVYRRCTLMTHTYSNAYSYNNNVLTIKFSVDNAKDEFYQEGLFYILNTSTTDYAVSRIPNHILKLRRKQVIQQTLTVDEIQAGFNPLPKEIILTFEAPDKRSSLPQTMSSILTNLYPTQPKVLFLYVLDAYSPPRIIEANVGVGYYTNSSDNSFYYCLNDTDIVKNSSQRIAPEPGDIYTPELISIGLDYIVLGDQGEKQVFNHYQPSPNGTVVVNTGPFHDTGFVIRRQTISYEYIALPVIIRSAQRIDYTTIKYVIDVTVEGAFDTMTKYYQGRFAYVIDAWSNSIFTLSSITTSTEGKKVMILKLNNFYGDIIDMPHIMTPRVIYIVPFKFYVLTQLGSDTAPSFVPTLLGVGTNNVRETLTVAGDASFVREISIKDPNSSRQNFKLSYSNDVLDMNRGIEIKQNLIVLNRATEISGSITATDIHKASDNRIKRVVPNINRHHSSDMDRIKKVKIHNFTFCNDHDNTIHKGVIAQELQRTIPEAVHRTKDQRVIECMNRYFQVDELGRLVMDEHFAKTVVSPGSGVLDIAIVPKYVNDQSEYQRYKVTDYFKCPETGKFIIDVLPTLDPSFKEVYVGGVWDTCLTVNYEYLYMMGLNVIKDMSAEMNSLKMEVNAIKSSLSLVS